MGSTSSRETSWLIPAIRRKDRSGPGMTTVPDGAACGKRLSETCASLEWLESVCPAAGVFVVQQVNTRRKATM
jgi:hypothetical protein